MMNKRGFTLMEILAVLLVIAVVTTFAVPVVKSIRVEIQYKQAQAAAKEMMEAIRSYYADSKGYLAVNGEIQGTNLTGNSSLENSCVNPGQNGIPASNNNSQQSTFELFNCGYF